jgi:endoglucanase
VKTRLDLWRVLAATVTTSAVVLAGAAVPVTAQADEPPNLVANGAFEPGVHDQWWGITDADVTDGELCLDVPAVERFGNFVALGLTAGESYLFGFTAHGEPGTDGLEARVQSDGAAGPEVFDVRETFAVGTEPQDYEWGFTASGDAQRVQFELAGAQPAGGLCLTDVHVTPLAHLAQNPTFDGLEPWWTTANLALAETGGRMCGTVPAGGNQWDVILGQSGIALEPGSSYTVTLTASAPPGTTGRILVPRPGADWPPLFFADVALDGTFTQTFEVDAAADTQLQLQVGGNAEELELCLDLFSLTTGGTVPEFEHETGPRVRVNQVGYLPDGPKRATVVTDATEPLPWELHDATGAVVATGTTEPAGTDASAGLDVHTVDLGDVTATGEGFRLVADGEESYPFAISATVYDTLRTDALGIYYTQRSGTEIVPVVVDGVEEKAEHARPAGHVDAPGDGVNQGDVDLPCLPPTGAVDANGAPQLGADDHYGVDGWACPDGYVRDVSGGWYDAGDHGKYVVNAGISVYQLLSAYERSLHAGTVESGALGDGTLVIPERGNDVPDVLDEVRHELEFMLAMQVPRGTTMTIDGESFDAGGLVHHKVHDIAWTGLNLLPSEDPQPRYLHRPSTAATLNLAAAAAQGARLYEPYDAGFADDLRRAAKRAWVAAAAHPEIYAPNTNVIDPNPGGGPYDDTDVTDERYWAAAQLYLTTGGQRYADAVLGSPLHVGGAREDVWKPTGFDWGWTAPAARLDLATVPSTLPGRADVVASVVAAADGYVAIQQSQPFGLPYAPEGGYAWGSTHQVLNNAVVVATAYDLTGDQAYRDAALEAADYVLGRNAINNSYVKGYGTYFSQKMHNRWMASADRLPPHPDGMLSGGPNSALDDPVSRAALEGCAPQACYIDHVDAWSTNEMTINWNSALAWYASWADDMASVAPDAWEPPTPTCEVGYTVHGTWPGGFVSQLWVTNLGPGARDGWELGWRFDGDQRVVGLWGGDAVQDGAAATVTNEPWNARLADPGARGGSTVTLGFVGAARTGTDHVPDAFTLDGMWCATA